MSTPDVTQTDTTDPEDIRALALAVVALVTGSPEFDDMTWAEVQAALALANAQIKTNWVYTGSVKPEAPVVPLAASASAAQTHREREYAR